MDGRDLLTATVLVGGFGTFGQRTHAVAPIHKVGEPFRQDKRLQHQLTMATNRLATWA